VLTFEKFYLLGGVASSRLACEKKFLKASFAFVVPGTFSSKVTFENFYAWKEGCKSRGGTLPSSLPASLRYQVAYSCAAVLERAKKFNFAPAEIHKRPQQHFELLLCMLPPDEFDYFAAHFGAKNQCLPPAQ